MERFISLLLSGIMSGNVTAVNLQDTGRVQEQYVIESYFNWVDAQTPLVYRSGRILGQTFDGIEGGRLTNRTDCSGMLVGHMVQLGLVESRYIKGMDGLDSDTLVTLGEPKRRADVKRGDWVYMQFADGMRHVAVACDDRGENIYDFYLDRGAKCREQPPAALIRYASNGAAELLKNRGIILQETKDILDYFQRIKDETSKALSGDVLNVDPSNTVVVEYPTSPNLVDAVVDRVRTVVSA